MVPISELTDRLIRIPKMGNGIGLHRMAWFYEQVCSEFNIDFEAIKITGSNGKGAVATMIHSIFQEVGILHGLYTSPHLRRFNERMKVGNQTISDEHLAQSIQWFEKRHAEFQASFPGDDVGAFEAFTSTALHHFAQQSASILVLEAGIGGRYDPTRIVPGSLVALTSLDLEHTAILGNTLEQIAFDKIDMCPANGTLVLGEVDSDLLRRIQAYCQLKSIRLLPIQEMATLKNSRYQGTSMVVDLGLDGTDWPDLELTLQGKHQAQNAAIALLLVQEWFSKNKGGLPPNFSDAARRALSHLTWPGRFQKIHNDPQVFIDVGHSPAAIETLVQTVRKALKDQKILLLTGVSHNKNMEGIVAPLIELADEVICTRAYHRGGPVGELTNVVARINSSIPCSSQERIEDAMAQALQIAKAKQMTVLVAGGLFLSIEAHEALLGHDPQALRFF